MARRTKGTPGTEGGGAGRMQGEAVVAGVGESAYYERGQSPDSEFRLGCEAIRNAGPRETVAAS